MKKIQELIGMAMLGFSPWLLAASPYQHSEGWHGIIGVGILLETMPYKEMDQRILPLPYLIMRRGNFFIEGLELGYRAIEGANGHFDLIITPRLDGFEADESHWFDGMEDREFSIDGGVVTKWRQGTVEFNLTALTDILDKNGGQELSVSVGNTYLAGKMATLTPSLGLKWQSDDLVDYYYGVTTYEARPDRPAYMGEATLNYTAALNGTYSLGKRSTLFGGIEYERLGQDISDSPLLETEQIISIFMGYGWQF